MEELRFARLYKRETVLNHKTYRVSGNSTRKRQRSIRLNSKVKRRDGDEKYSLNHSHLNGTNKCPSCDQTMNSDIIVTPKTFYDCRYCVTCCGCYWCYEFDFDWW